MKKTLLITMMCCIGSLCAQAQWSFGVKAGATYSTMGDPLSKTVDIEANHRLGPVAGLMAALKLNDDFSLQGEIDYARRGFKTDLYVDMANSKRDWNFSFHYIDLPILLQYRLFGKPLYLELGPKLGYLIDSSSNIEDYDEDVSFNYDTNKMDFGLVGGIGVDISDHISGDIRYYHGLTNATKSPGKGKHHGFEISIGYWF